MPGSVGERVKKLAHNTCHMSFGAPAQVRGNAARIAPDSARIDRAAERWVDVHMIVPVEL
jgi:hypothetical protein